MANYYNIILPRTLILGAIMKAMNLRMKSGESVEIQVLDQDVVDKILKTFKYGWCHSFDLGIDVKLANGSPFYFRFDSIESITLPTQ